MTRKEQARKRRAIWRCIGYFIAHGVAFALVPQHYKALVFAVASLTYCFLWIGCGYSLDYWFEEWGRHAYLKTAWNLARDLYDDKVSPEEILRGYIRAGLEKDVAKAVDGLARIKKPGV